VLYKGAPEGVIVDFIKAINQEENATFLEKWEQGVAETSQGRVTGDIRNVSQECQDRAVDMLAPLATANQDRREIEVW